MTLDVLQDRIGYRFKDESLLVLAVTHSSWANEHSAGNAHNERLEFLGDAVLEIAVSASCSPVSPMPGKRVDASAFQPRQRGHAGGHCAQAAS